MLTPQQIDEVTLDTAVFGGYDTKSVDAFLEPLIADYVTLYKENALLKSKMRVLVEKLEEYRANEANLRDAMDNAQKKCDQMILDAQSRCNQMIAEAESNAAGIASDEARRQNDARLNQVQEQLRTCISSLEQMKFAPAPEIAEARSTDAMAAEIAANLQSLIG